MKPPGATSLQQLLELIGRDLMESSQGFFFVDFQKKLKEHPKCSYRENEEEMDGMKELPKNSPSQMPQLFLNQFNFQNELFP